MLLARALLLLALLAPGLAAAVSLPFVDDSGLVRMDLRYGDVVKQLGESPVSRIVTEYGESRAEGDHVFEYPAQGLMFTIRADERQRIDPRVASMRVTRPEAGATLQGLAVGQVEAEARALVVRHYRVLRNEAGVLAGGQPEGASRRVVVVEFQGGRVSALSFDTSEPPKPPSRLWQAVKGAFGLLLGAAGLLLVGGVAWLLQRFFEKRVVGPPGGGSPVLHGLAGLVFIGSLVLGVVGLSLLRAGSYAGLLGLLLIVGAGCGVFVGLMLLTRSRHRGVSFVAGGLLLLILMGSLLAKLLH